MCRNVGRAIRRNHRCLRWRGDLCWVMRGGNDRMVLLNRRREGRGEERTRGAVWRKAPVPVAGELRTVGETGGHTGRFFFGDRGDFLRHCGLPTGNSAITATGRPQRRRWPSWNGALSASRAKTCTDTDAVGIGRTAVVIPLSSCAGPVVASGSASSGMGAASAECAPFSVGRGVFPCRPSERLHQQARGLRRLLVQSPPSRRMPVPDTAAARRTAARRRRTAASGRSAPPPSEDREATARRPVSIARFRSPACAKGQGQAMEGCRDTVPPAGFRSAINSS